MRSIRSQIRLHSIILVALPLFMSAVIFSLITRGAMERTATAEIEMCLEHIDTALDEWLRQRTSDVVFLSRIEVVRQLDKSAMPRLFKEFLDSQSEFADIVFINREGLSEIVTRSRTGLGIDSSDRDFFQDGVQGRPALTGPLMGRAMNRPFIAVSAPVMDREGVFQGVVLAPVRLEKLQDMIALWTRESRVDTYITDKRGVAITAPAHAGELQRRGLVQGSGVLEFTNTTRIMARALAGDDSHEPYPNYLGQPVLGGYRWTKGGEWLVVQEVGLDTVHGAWRTSLAVFALGSLAALLVMTPLLIRLSENISRPIRTLSVMAERIKCDKFCELPEGALSIKGPEEIVSLAESFKRMATDIQDSMARLDHLSCTDQLTGLGNRRFLVTEGQRAINNSLRAGQPCSCMILDIDHFKRINDQYGHMTGDEVLKRLAAIIAWTVRTSDVVARFGGEEFVVIAPNSNAIETVALAERVRASVSSEPMLIDRQSISFTVSVGVSEVSDDINFGAGILDDILTKADRALYQAKSGGRDRVAVFVDPTLDDLHASGEVAAVS